MKMLRRAASTTPPPAAPPLPSKDSEALTTRRVEVIVEREWAREAVSLSAIPPASFEAHCIACGTRVSMFTPAAAALLAKVTVRTIYRWVDEKKLHFIESPAGDLFLCARSIQASSQVPATIRQLPSGDSR